MQSLDRFLTLPAANDTVEINNAARRFRKDRRGRSEGHFADNNFPKLS